MRCRSYLVKSGGAIAAIMLACLAPADARAGERILVLSQTAAMLSEIAGESGELSSIPLAKAPAALALAPDSELAYVTHPDLGEVSVIDLSERRFLRTIKVPGSPFGIAAASGGRIYVADWNGNEVSVIDTLATAPARTLKVGRAPAHLLLSPDQQTLFVANRKSDDVSVLDVSVIDGSATNTADEKQTAIAVGRAPFAMALSPDGKRLYVGNVQGGSVSVIDTVTLTSIETRKSGAMPYGAAVTPDGSRVLITNQQSGTVAVLSEGSAPPDTIRVGGYPEGIAVSADGRRAYVANWFSDDVSVVDLVSKKEIRRIKCPGGPRSVVLRTENSDERP